ncbi:unnamed protein product [Arabis nemorensis]|uniref:Uncharacterized protein n=1 Tax=Arabis nemorensis TaxID=586526 RepID=A0A565BSJ4_9BRAS|nr:unnamed protein product [Arabis nemorensis]
MLKKQPSYGIGVVACWGVAVKGLGGSTYNVVLDNMSVWKNMYAGDLLPVPEPSDINIGENVTNVKIIPPATRQQACRRRKVRIPSTGAW